MQKQRANPPSLATKLSKAGKIVQLRVVGINYYLYADGELMADKSL